MSRWGLVDPEPLLALDAFPSLTVSHETLPALRGAMAQMIAARALSELPVVCKEVWLPSREPRRSIRTLLLSAPGAYQGLKIAADAALTGRAAADNLRTLRQALAP